MPPRNPLARRLGLSRIQSNFTPQQATALDDYAQGIRQVPEGYVLAYQQTAQTFAAGWNRVTLDAFPFNEGGYFEEFTRTFKPAPGQLWRVSAAVDAVGTGVSLNDWQGLALFDPTTNPTVLGIAASLQAAKVILYAAEVGATRAAHLHGTADYTLPPTEAFGLVLWAWLANTTSEVSGPGLGHTWFSAERLR